MEEQYKDIEGYEGLYMISNKGNVYSKYSNKILKPIKFKTNVTTYLRVDLVKNKLKCKVSIHRLVATAFIPNIDNKPCVNHIDNDASNNCVTNLEWCTYSENLIHAQKQGRLYDAQSKGGLATLKKAKDNATNDALSMVGKVYGTWVVLSHDGTKVLNNKLERHIFTCKCKKCNCTKVLDRPYLKTNPSNCRECDSKNRVQQCYEKACKDLIGNKINTWTITGITSPITTIRSSKIQLKCECGNIDKAPYAAMSKNKLKKCPVCKVG